MAPANIESDAPASGQPRQLPAGLKQVLLARRAQLLIEVADGQQRRLNEESFGSLAGEVADAGDASLATEQSDLRNTQIERDLAELRDIDTALQRFEDGSYGICVRCGRDIAVARLRANPSAPRCIECQIAYEHQFAGNTASSL
jgi:DnaK suppressor protein